MRHKTYTMLKPDRVNEEMYNASNKDLKRTLKSHAYHIYFLVNTSPSDPDTWINRFIKLAIHYEDKK